MNKSISQGRKRKRFVVVGCSHGNLIDPINHDSVVGFVQRFKPDKVIHLGDFVDLACWRSGAKGTSDESRPNGPDIDAGLSFLKEIRANLVFCGNHEARLWRMTSHQNAIVRDLAEELIRKIRTRVALNKGELVEHWDLFRGWRVLGNFKLCHGFYFSENATRDHAESLGNVIHAHTHRVALAKGRREDNPTGICVGTLADIPNMDYAAQRRATQAWSSGMVYGEYDEEFLYPNLCEKPRESKSWNLPI
jgi:predicted phosphodiesterase